MSKDQTFTQPVLHVIHGHRVITTRPHTDNRWFDQNEIIALHNERFRITKQQHGVFHYYVWVEPFTEGVPA
jgi:hypothetical protein